MKKNIFINILLIILILGGASFAIAQEAMRTQAVEPQTQETESFVPELEAFHEIIYPIWHTAYPNKDYAALRSFVPQINSLAENIYTAKLPGILRDKQGKWETALAELKSSVANYNLAARGPDDTALLAAAEELHMRYEMAVRAIRPVLKEVDDFHKLLYVIYHKYLPEKKYELINGVADELQVKAEAVTKATLSKRLEPKKEAFKAAADDLYKATEELTALKQSTDGKAISLAVEKIHTKYQALEKAFD